MDQWLTGNRPMIFLTGHYGNWELAGYLFGMFGFPTVSVARPLDNVYLDRFLRSFRERTGQTLIPKTGGFDQMVEVLRDNRVLSFLADQDAGQRGLFVDFFGRPASAPQGDRALGDRAQGAGRRGSRAANRPRLPVRDPLRGCD